MKKVCFVSMGNIYSTPYINTYINHFSDNVSYDLIYWDRENINEKINANHIYKFNHMTESNRDAKKINLNSANKLLGYFRFSKYATKILNDNNYDYIILLHTYAAVFTRKTLLNKYRHKYIIDIRDYTFENNKIYYSNQKKLIENSLQTVISSEGYKNFLPEYDYLISHNNHDYQIQLTEADIKSRGLSTINIAFIGAFGYKNQQQKLIHNLKNHSIITLSYVGKGSSKLSKLLIDNKIQNVELTDRFEPKDTYKYYSEVSFINNLYGNNNMILDFALSNKLYYAAELKIPILVSPNTYMAEISTKYGFGIIVDDLEDENLDEKLFNYYINNDWVKFNGNCNEFIAKVNEDNQRMIEFISSL